MLVGLGLMEKHCWKPGGCSEFLVICDETASRNYPLKITVLSSTSSTVSFTRSRNAKIGWMDETVAILLLVHSTLRPVHNRINPKEQYFLQIHCTAIYNSEKMALCKCQQ